MASNIQKQLEDFRAFQYIETVAMVILVYDYLLSLSDEVHYIWKARWNAGKWIYLGIRYNATIELTASTAISLTTGARSQNFCTVWYFVDGFGAWIHVAFVTYLLSLRTKALYPSHPYLNAFTFALGAVCMIAAGTLIVLEGASPTSLNVLTVAPVRAASGCLFTSAFPLLHYVWVTHIVFEFWVLLLTLFRAFEQIYSRTLHLTPLFKALYQDGFIYAFVILCIATVNLLFWLFVHGVALATSIIPLYRCFVCVLGSHIILTLRAKRDSLSRGHKRFDAINPDLSGTVAHLNSPRLNIRYEYEETLDPPRQSEQMSIRMSFADLEELAREDEAREDEIIELGQLSGIWNRPSPAYNLENQRTRATCAAGPGPSSAGAVGS